MNFLSLSQEEKVTSILPMPENIKKATDLCLFLMTKDGTIKKMEAAQFHDVRRNGLIAITLDSGDRLVSAHFVRTGDDVICVTSDGQSIRFEEAEVRAMGRTAGGVRGMKIDKADSIVGVGIIPKGNRKKSLFVVSKTGYGKKTEVSEYKTQSRGGSGVMTMSITDKTKQIIAAAVVEPESGEFVVVSSHGQVIRSSLAEVPTLSRVTQGVRIMRLRDGDTIASATVLEDHEDIKEGK
jgi:DNA gyrase subunit A